MYDLVVFGAAGFTGSLAAEYFAQKMPEGRRWAVAGRSREKLDALKIRLSRFRAPPSEYQVIDHSNAAAVRGLVSQSKVAINYAGPFGRYGENIVASCAELGVHYLDITGETLWARTMIDKYESLAEKSGAILIPFSGFDSVPSDLGAWKVVELARAKDAGRGITRVINLISVNGGINGGTFQTVLDILAFDKTQMQSFLDTALLVPARFKEKFKFKTLMRPVHVPEEGVTAPPFFMESVNSRVVYGSQALPGGALFEYIELGFLSKVASSLTAWGVVVGTAAFTVVGRHGWAQKLLKKYGVKSGQGPSAELQENGFFRAKLFAYAGQELVARFEMFYAGDPGNKATVLLSWESTFCLMESLGKIPAKKGGFWTPSTALGSVLYERLEAAGVKFQV